MKTSDKVEALKSIIQKHKVTQDSVARDLGVTLVSLNRWLNGRAVPRKEAEKRISQLIAKYKTENDSSIDQEHAISVESLDSVIYSENILELFSKQLSESVFDVRHMLLTLLEQLAEKGRNYDWNVGSILQHFDPELVVEVFKKVENLPRLYNSIGLAWVLGELNRRDHYVITYLKDVVKYATNSDAVWRAAYSLENLGEDDAIVLLKRSIKIDRTMTIEEHIANIADKKSLIHILVLSNLDNLEKIIYPAVKKIYLETRDVREIVNCCWLIGRLGLLDKEIFQKIVKHSASSDYEVKYYTYFALQHNGSEALLPLFEKGLLDINPLIRKLSARSLRRIAHENSLVKLIDALVKEKDPAVISEISTAIYAIKNPLIKADILLLAHSVNNENGMIADESDKWYKDASLYHKFSEAEDPQNLCFTLLSSAISGRKIVNPIDLATGTGRYLFQIQDKLAYDGVLYGIDYSKDMCEFVEKRIRREKYYTKKIQVIHSAISDISQKVNVKSTFIVSSFGFPSRITDKELVLSELKAVYELLEDGGIFATVGWDESFNDSLNSFWYKYIPDAIQARSFEEWRRKRSATIDGARNCRLTWYKKGIITPLQFNSLSESVEVMGYLFGRDAAKHIVIKKITKWDMSIGLTLDTKESLKKIIESYERN